MLIQIYIATEKILEILQKEEKIELSYLCSSLDSPRDVVVMSLGWLIRKGHVILEKEEESYQLSLRKDGQQKPKSIKCPDCRLGRQNFCLAYSKSLMIPSVEELKSFCLSGEYENCPLQVKANC